MNKVQVNKEENTRLAQLVFKSNEDEWRLVKRSASAEICRKTRRYWFSLSSGAMISTGLLSCGTQRCQTCAEGLALSRLSMLDRWSEPFETLYLAPVSRRDEDWEEQIGRLSDRLYRKRNGPADFYLHVRRAEFVGVVASVQLSGRKKPDLWVPMPRLLALEVLGAWMEVPGVEAVHSSQDATEGPGEEEGEEEGERLMEDLGLMTDKGFSELVEKAASLYERMYGFKPAIINGSLVDSRVKFQDWLQCLTTMRGS